MKTKKKNSPNPQFAFKIEASIKEELMNNIQTVTDSFNKMIGPDDCRFRKNEIIIEALRIGLQQLGKEKVKK